MPFGAEPEFQSFKTRLAKLESTPPSRQNPGDSIQHIPDATIDGLARQFEVDSTQQLANGETEESNREDDPGSISKQVLPVIDGFRIERLVGQGGFSRVYRAWDVSLDRRVAIKVLDASRIDARNRNRFLREAKTTAGLESPNVVQIFGAGVTQQRLPYLVMEYVAGGSLHQFTSELDELTPAKIDLSIRYVIQAAEGLQQVHDAGIVHRDVKPGNILIKKCDSLFEMGTATLSDFGLVKFVDQSSITLTRTAELVGTPAFMSPEQASEAGETDRRSDVYSLGATLYRSITGQTPFLGSTINLIRQINELEPTSPRRLNEFVSYGNQPSRNRRSTSSTGLVNY